jgi:hypothetical protein
MCSLIFKIFIKGHGFQHLVFASQWNQRIVCIQGYSKCYLVVDIVYYRFKTASFFFIIITIASYSLYYYLHINFLKWYIEMRLL